MVLCEAVALRKPITAGHSEQEFPWCYTDTVMGPARMVLNLCNGEYRMCFFPPAAITTSSFLPDSQTANPIWQGTAGLEEDVLQAHKVLPTEGAVWWHAAAVQALPHPLLEGMKCWWDSLGWGRSHGALSASSDCSSLKELQFLRLHKLVCRHRKYLGSPPAIKTLLLCFRLSDFFFLRWTNCGHRGPRGGRWV